MSMLHIVSTVLNLQAAMLPFQDQCSHKEISVSCQHHYSFRPSGLCRFNGKRPDGLSIIPWKQGQTLVDITCPDTFTPSYTD